MTDIYARASASNTSESFGIGRLVVETWKLDNSTCPPWTKDTRMCNPKGIMRTHAHSQLVIMRTHALQGAMLPMELRKWLEGQIRLHATAICWRIWKQMVANWSMPDFQPFSLDTIYTETSIQLRTDKFNNLKQLSVASIYFLFGLGSMALPDFLHHIRLLCLGLPQVPARAVLDIWILLYVSAASVVRMFGCLVWWAHLMG